MLAGGAWGAMRHAGLIALLVLLGCGPSSAPPPSAEYERAVHLGAGHLENQNAAEAVAAFEEAAALAPERADAQRNLARALLLARDGDAALSALARARATDPDSAATEYLSGIAQARAARFEEAVAHLERAVQLDPATATVRFQLAGAYQALGRDDEAKRQLEEAIRLDPLHLAAHYRLAGQARGAGDEQALRRMQTEITRLRGVLGQEDPSPEALEVCVHTRAEFPERAVAEPDPVLPRNRFEPIEELGDLGEARVVAVLGLDRSGRYSLVGVDAAGRVVVWRVEAGERFAEVVFVPGPGSDWLREHPVRLVVGNFHDVVPADARYDPEVHARSDVLVLGPGGVLLLEQRPSGFADVTERAGLLGVGGLAASWLDYDHDGDLDLAVAGESGIALWQNGGDGRFEEVAARVGIEVGGGVLDVAAADLAMDGAIDLVVAGAPGPTRVFEGLRTGRFGELLAPPGPWPSARRVLLDDLAGDGAPDALLVDGQRAVVMPAAGGPGATLDLGGLEASSAALVDYDSDGRLEVLVAGTRDAEGGDAQLQLWRRVGPRQWQEIGESAGLRDVALPPVFDVQAADLDGDGAPDLLVSTAAGVRVLHNVGGESASLLAVRLTGTKTNPAGYGVRLTARAPGFRATRFVSGVAVEIGLGGRKRLDSLQTIWTNGVVDNQLDLQIGDEPVTIVEQNVAAGSCPYLYAWDGEHFRFVTDLLGNAPIGLSRRRDVPLPADPDEIVWIGDASRLPRRDGAYVLQVTDELREVVYLDEARLLAVDHPPDAEVHPTDRLMEPPFPPSEVWALASPRVPASALGDDGIDRTADVARIDGRFAPPGPLLPPPLRGKTRPLALTLDFGRLDDFAQPVLALTGWLQYGDASRNIALSQNRSVEVVPPTLEVETAAGEWRAVDVVVGMPAGKTKTIVVDLSGKLPAGAKRLRLRTTFELRWDRIALLERLPDSALAVHELAPTAARLAARGYSVIRARAPGHPPTPRHADLLDRPPWETTPVGFVTRFGDVLQLMASRDDQLVVMNGGDALELSFGSSLPEPADGARRSFFFYSVGWDKDEDVNVIDGTTVEPLPVAAGAGGEQRVRFHTRFVPRDAPRSRRAKR